MDKTRENENGCFPDGWDGERLRTAVQAARALLAKPAEEREAQRSTLREAHMAEGLDGPLLARIYRLNPGEKPATDLIVVRARLAETGAMAILLRNGSLCVMAREGHEADDLATIAAGRCIFAEQGPEEARP